MNSIVSVAVHSEKSSLLGGPVPAIVAVTNPTAQPVEILLPYPNPNNLSFECYPPTFVKKTQVKPQEIERTIPVRIAPGDTYSVTYYLNRYFAFQKAGKAEVSYWLRMFVTSKAGTAAASHESAEFTGQFEITLIAASQDELRIHLAKHAGKLMSSNRQEKIEAAEALAFLDTPVSVEYIIPMLSIDNLETIGIEALGRHPSPQSFKLIVGMLAHQDSSVVAAALNEIDRLKISIARNEIYKLVASTNPNNRWLALDWLSKRPDKQDLAVIQPLTQDDNNSVREQAKKYIEVLRRM